MDLAALKTVLLVGQQGSFASAARVLNVDPSSVSRTVSQVEATLGLRLFQRTTRSLRVTEAGDAYLKRIKPLVEELDQAGEIAAGTQRQPAGQLRMTASVAFAHECIVPHLDAFHATYPEVSVELLPSDANLDIAAEGIDLAVRLAAAPRGDVISTRILSTRYRVCASPAYLAQHGPLTGPEELEHHACLRFALPEFRARWRFRSPTTGTFEVPVSGKTVIANALSLRRAAVAGLGPVMLADWLVAHDLASGALVDLFPQYECTATTFDTGAWALYPSRSYLPRKVRVMIDFLRDRLNAEPLALPT